MKQKKSVFSVVFSLVMVICTWLLISNMTMMEGETYLYRNHHYIPCGGRYIKDELISFTKDGIVIYSVKGDSNKYFLVDSLGCDLYVRDDVEIPKENISGVFLNSSYFEDEELIQLVNDINNTTALEINTKCNCQAINTSEFSNIYVCYNNIQATQGYIGCIACANGTYVYIDSEEICNSVYTGESRIFQGVAIKTEYNDICKLFLGK